MTAGNDGAPYTVTLNASGPADPEHLLEVMEAFAECVRVANHLARHHEALEYPSEADMLIGYLATAASRLPQLLGQVSGWYEQEQAAGRIRVPPGGGWRSGWGEPDAAVAAARRKLEAARMVAEELHEALDAARSVTCNLAPAVPEEGTEWLTATESS